MPLLQVVEDDQISSKKYLAVEEEELAKMIEENQELKRKLAARGMWTLTTATSYVEGHNNTWVVNNILNVPRFHKFLQDTVVSYPPPGKKGYLFHPKPWLDFLDKWFPEISRSLREKGNNDWLFTNCWWLRRDRWPLLRPQRKLEEVD